MTCLIHNVSVIRLRSTLLWILTARFSPSVVERESRLCPHLASNTSYVLCHAVEQRKSRLTAKQSLRSNVDWLTEAIRRFSEAYTLGRDFSTVTMSNVFRSEKVRGCIFCPSRLSLTFVLRCTSGRLQKLAMLTVSGTSTKWQHLKMPFLPTALNCVPSATKLAHARSTRLCAITGTGKSMLLSLSSLILSDFNTPLPPPKKSMKLGEENRRRRLLGTSKTPPLSAHSMPSADDSDSEGSIVRAPSKAHSSCGACRTRDTKQWWKAPKGLATPVLCDACGISWRKYADLNHLRPIREEAAAAKQGKAEKREGTPLPGSNSKRVKVSVSSIGVRMSVLSLEDRRRRPTGQYRPLHRRRRVMGLRSIAVLHVTSMVLVRCLSAKSAKRAFILVSFK